MDSRGRGTAPLRVPSVIVPHPGARYARRAWDAAFAALDDGYDFMIVLISNHRGVGCKGCGVKQVRLGRNFVIFPGSREEDVLPAGEADSSWANLEEEMLRWARKKGSKSLYVLMPITRGRGGEKYDTKLAEAASEFIRRNPRTLVVATIDWQHVENLDDYRRQWLEKIKQEAPCISSVVNAPAPTTSKTAALACLDDYDSAVGIRTYLKIQEDRLSRTVGLWTQSCVVEYYDSVRLPQGGGAALATCFLLSKRKKGIRWCRTRRS